MKEKPGRERARRCVKRSALLCNEVESPAAPHSPHHSEASLRGLQRETVFDRVGGCGGGEGRDGSAWHPLSRIWFLTG